MFANLANVTQGPAGNTGAKLRKSLAEQRKRLPLLGNDDDTANRQYTKTFALDRDRSRGQAHGLEYAEYFHYIGPDESEVDGSMSDVMPCRYSFGTQKEILQPELHLAVVDNSGTDAAEIRRSQ